LCGNEERAKMFWNNNLLVKYMVCISSKFHRTDDSNTNTLPEYYSIFVQPYLPIYGDLVKLGKRNLKKKYFCILISMTKTGNPKKKFNSNKNASLGLTQINWTSLKNSSERIKQTDQIYYTFNFIKLDLSLTLSPYLSI
jgi:hypothetical protein